MYANQPLSRLLEMLLIGMLYAHAHRLNMEMKLFLFTIWGLEPEDLVLGMGGGFNVVVLGVPGRGELVTFLSMPLSVLLRFSSLLLDSCLLSCLLETCLDACLLESCLLDSCLLLDSCRLGISCTGDVALATNAGPG